MTTVRQIESIVPLPDNQGYAVTFTTIFEPGILRAHDRIKGLHYKQKPPVLNFGMRFDAQADPYTLKFVCDCTDNKLMQSELLVLLQAISLAPEELTELPIPTAAGKPSPVGSRVRS
jgi:hypothetical protein